MGLGVSPPPPVVGTGREGERRQREVGRERMRDEGRKHRMREETRKGR